MYNHYLCSAASDRLGRAQTCRVQVFALLLLICSLFSQPCVGDEVAKTSGLGSDSLVIPEAGELFKDTAWHKNKWQNMPAIIEISAVQLNLLFNRPEIVFGLRRAINFAWDETHEYSDGKVLTTYSFSRLGERQALIEYQSVLVEDHAQTASGSFVIESRP